MVHHSKAGNLKNSRLLSAVFLQRNIWAAAFGGVAAADMIGLYVFKPLTAINSAIVGSQRLAAVHLRLLEQLNTCNQFENLKERIDCQTTVWDTVQKELAALSN